MPRCEMCGNKEASLTTIKTSQAELDVCSSCEELGTEVDTGDETSSDTKYSTSSSSSNTSTTSSDHSSRSSQGSRSETSRDTGSNLRMDYGDAIRSARENRGMSVSELANEMNEKASHLRGVENGERQPTESLQKRLESELGISLSSDSDDIDDYEASDVEGTTLGDVVDFNEN